MSRLEPRDQIEELVGATRHDWAHIGRMDTDAQRIYVLHPRRCIERLGIDLEDLRDCAFSVALDHGLVERSWEGREDVPVLLVIRDGLLAVSGLLAIS